MYNVLIPRCLYLSKILLVPNMQWRNQTKYTFQGVKVAKKRVNSNITEKEYKNFEKNLDKIKKDSNFAPQNG